MPEPTSRDIDRVHEDTAAALRSGDPDQIKARLFALSRAVGGVLGLAAQWNGAFSCSGRSDV